jgi:hypothetical protein
MNDKTTNPSSQEVTHHDNWWSRLRRAAEMGVDALADGDLESAFTYIDTVMSSCSGTSAFQYLNQHKKLSVQLLNMVQQAFVSTLMCGEIPYAAVLTAVLEDNQAEYKLRESFGVCQEEFDGLLREIKEDPVVAQALVNLIVAWKAGEPGLEERLIEPEDAA